MGAGHSKFAHGSNQVSLLDLPDSVVNRITQYLNEQERKALSVTCYRLLERCERTFEQAPRLFIPYKGSIATQPDRIIIESENLKHLNYPAIPMVKDLQYFWLIPPAYRQLNDEPQPGQFRRQRQKARKEARLWLCPHTGCTFDNLKALPRAPGWLINDTRLAACAFPKCALWARHAIVNTSGADSVDELCSVFRVYRTQCLYDDPRQIRQKLSTISRTQFHSVMKHLQMPICCHLQLGSIAVTSQFDPDNIAIIPQTAQRYSDSKLWANAAKCCFDRSSCKDCQAEGTYTSWGFFARPYKSAMDLGGIVWLDIELSLARPFALHYDYHEIGSNCIHWKAHCIPPSAMSTFVESWWKWAGKVANEGFDWRARLPSGFLQANRSALVNFTQMLPPYQEYDPHLETVDRQERAYSRADSTLRLDQNHPIDDWYTWGRIPRSEVTHLL